MPFIICHECRRLRIQSGCLLPFSQRRHCQPAGSGDKAVRSHTSHEPGIHKNIWVPLINRVGQNHILAVNKRIFDETSAKHAVYTPVYVIFGQPYLLRLLDYDDVEEAERSI